MNMTLYVKHSPINLNTLAIVDLQVHWYVFSGRACMHTLKKLITTVLKTQLSIIGQSALLGRR